MIYRSDQPDIDVPAGPLTPVVFRHAERLADRVAMVDASTERSYTYAELHGASRRLAGGLVARGLEPGDVVAIVAPNLPEYAIVFHGVIAAGGTVTTVNPTYTAPEIARQLVDSGPRFVVTIGMFVERVQAAVDEYGAGKIYVIGEAADGYGSISELLSADPIDQVTLDPEDSVAVLPYSSGTTGMPKGVELTHRNLAVNLLQYEQLSDVDEHDVALAVLPFFHIYGMQILMNAALHAGAKVVTMPRFDLAEFLQAIETHRVTRLAVVPPIVVALAKHPIVDDYDLSSLVQIGSGAAPLSADVEERAAERAGAEITQGFGLTETGPVTHLPLPGNFKPGTIGVLVANTEARLVHPESGEDLGPGEDGELWLRGPQVMKGYLNNPAATASAIDEDGWFHTGDIAVVDEDGHWRITDRLKELIKYKGFQVAPAELEALLLTHPGVADAGVIGIADDEAGEVPKAFIVRQPDSDVTAEEIMDHIAGHVASFKQVREVEFLDEIPKSLSGKILRRVLRDLQTTRAL